MVPLMEQIRTSYMDMLSEGSKPDKIKIRADIYGQLYKEAEAWVLPRIDTLYGMKIETINENEADYCWIIEAEEK